ncbi:hypothetical protein [Diaphorobacter ruginosibacter]|uniref:hypothetical protein n=1 Tax=Diaphorobacter ruginosibacter TaxID=1715720 RepID=UPI0033428586
MLEHLRRNRRLQDWVAALFCALVLTAMFSGMRVRAFMPQAPARMDICTASFDADHARHAGHMHAASSAPVTGMEHEGGTHHGPECLLCVALAPPEAAPLVRYQPPLSATLARWRFMPARTLASQPARAPLPPRGPPSRLA